MSIYATQRNATRNQSTEDLRFENLFLTNNRYSSGIFINNIGESLDAKSGILVVRNSGTFETATAKFIALTTGQTMIIAGLTYTSTGATTASQLAAAFANLAVGATTGAGTGTGAYSGALTAYSTSAVVGASLDTVVFTASTVGNKTDLAATGTGTSPTFTIVGGTAGVDEGFSPATSATLANVIGILKIDGINTMANASSLSANYALSGDIDTSLLILPNGVTLDSMAGSKALKDILTALGFVLYNVVETTKYDN
jgi:hypothetical protein